MLFSTAIPTTSASPTDHYLLSRLLAITHADFASIPANVELLPWNRIRTELSHTQRKEI